MKGRRRIVVVTGSRSEYGLLRSVLQALRGNRKIDLRLVVTGMHLSRRFGYSIQEIKKDGFAIAGCVPLTSDTGTPSGMARYVGRGVLGLTREFERLNPEIVMVLGDRTEAFSAAIAATYMNCVLAHIHGGDKSQGGVDESVRHAITKLAHLHFVATSQSAKRVQRLGERLASIFTVGSPAIDEVGAFYESRKDILDKVGMSLGDDQPYVVFLLHPITAGQARDSGTQARACLSALEQLDIPVVCLYPNNDTGASLIIEEIKRFHRRVPRSWVYRNLARRDYLSLLRHAAFLVGNSSGGVVESTSLHLAVINVGSRQALRERSGNVVDAPATRSSIARVGRRILQDHGWAHRLRRAKNVYGDGCAGERIARILATVRLGAGVLQKQITY
jgi:GDP/UDP-N,N'-diacetylbacillosamine 2-epimerase (hydrolysing)